MHLILLLAFSTVRQLDAFSTNPCIRTPVFPLLKQGRVLPTRWAKSSKDNDDEEEEKLGMGMDSAFQQLDQLISSSSSESAEPKIEPKKIELTAPIESTSSMSLEAEAKAFTDLAKGVENQSEDDLYDDLMAGMGSTSKAADKKVDDETADTVMSSSPSSDNNLSTDRGELMDRALREAMNEVNLNNPQITDSVLDDEDLMKEIESILDAGNDQLMASLEEVRKEQMALAKESADRSMAAAAETDEQTVERLANAEKSLSTALNRVQRESSDVQAAVDDLTAAKAALDDNPFAKLKQPGGLIKQASLVGVVLFAGRSLLDTFAALSGQPELLEPALVQAGIAVVFAIAFAVL